MIKTTTRFRMNLIPAMCAVALICVGQGCRPNTDPADSANTTTADDAAADAVTNRIDIPPAVRQNLGLTFVTVEPRRVEQTLRVPGRFEYLPTARREYRTMLPGRVELRVEQYDRVESGDVLYEIDSPGWREMQQGLTDADASISRLSTRLTSYGPLREAHHNHERRLEDTIAIRRERVAQLEQVAEAGGGRRADLVEARSEVSAAEAELAETLETEAKLQADEAAARTDLEAARTKRQFLLESASLLLRLDVETLQETVASSSGEVPRWRVITTIPVHADEPGVVESLGLTNGAWADQRSTVLTVVQPEQLRFRGVALQSDIARLRDGLPARIVAPSPTRAAGGIDLSDVMSGTLSVGLAGDAKGRTVDLFVRPDHLSSWARAGVSAHLEIITDETATAVVAIPKASVQQDGLTPVIFRRDPKDPNKAIRLEADLGLDDGRWIVVNSGVRVGDEIVLDGAFQLMLASAASGSDLQGGHFHADGTFHAGDDH